MKTNYLYWGLIISTLSLGSCQSEKATFYFSSRPASVAVERVAAPAPAMSAKQLPPAGPEFQALPARPSHLRVARAPKRLAAIAKGAIAVVSVRPLASQSSHMPYASKQRYSPADGGADAFGAILHGLSIVAIVLGLGLLFAGIAVSSVGVGGIIVGAILFGAGVAMLISLGHH